MQFSQHYIVERVDISLMTRKTTQIKSLIEKRLGITLYQSLMPDTYVNNLGKGIGIRYYFGMQAIRFNFDKSGNIYSVDLWDKSVSQDPVIRFETDRNDSTETTINKIITLIKNPNEMNFMEVTEAAVKKSTLSVKKISKETTIIDSRDEEEELNATKYADPEIVFKDLEKLVGFVIKGIRNGLIVSGKAGVGKSYTVEQVVQEVGLKKEKDYVIISGKSTPAALYQSLYQNKNKLLIYDDCDDVLKNKDGLNILKTALDTKDNRVVSWKSRNSFNPTDMETSEIKRLTAAGKLPDHFEFRGKVIFITNIYISEIDPTLLARSYTIDMTLKMEDIMLRIESIIGDILPEVPNKIKQEVLNYCKVIVNKGLYKRPFNIKVYIAAVNIRLTGDPDWKELVLRYA